jgi:N-acetylglucosamine kinase-like BadF-type ATPase
MSQYNDGKHARYKLREVMKFAKMLHDHIEPGDELPEWIMDKFTISANDLNESYQYLENKSIENKIRMYVREKIQNQSR